MQSQSSIVLIHLTGVLAVLETAPIIALRKYPEMVQGLKITPYSQGQNLYLMHRSLTYVKLLKLFKSIYLWMGVG